MASESTRCSLWWLLNSAVHLEVCHQLLHALKGVGKVAITESCHRPFDPLEEAGSHCIVVLLHVLNVHHDANDLYRGKGKRGKGEEGGRGRRGEGEGRKGGNREREEGGVTGRGE